MNNTALGRSLLVYAICLPLALLLGYLVTSLTDTRDNFPYIVFALVLFVLISPLLLRWYHAWLIIVWNMGMTLAFLPGFLPGWVPMACLGFGVAVGHYILNRERKFLSAPSIAWSLVFLAVVVAVTAKFRGGLGFHALGDESIGGKRYLWIWTAILGYFALVSQRIEPEKRKLYTGLFLFSAVAQAITDFGGLLGPALGPIYLIFPQVGSLAQSVPGAGPNLERFGGLANASMAVAFTMVARYGIEGVMNFRKIWRPIVFLSVLILSALGGYRGIMVTLVLTLVLVFYFEGLVRSRFMPVAIMGLILVGSLTVGFSDRLPLPMQRCLALLPVKIDPVARMSAETSTEWRLEIWKSLLPEVPQYLLLGKGLTFDSNDMAMYQTLGGQQVMGDVGGGFTLASDYHSGPLSLIIPFGIWGVIAFLWFLTASIKALWANYKYGDPDLKVANTFFLSYFITKMLFFFIIFGGFYSDVAIFAGIIGFSISLNGGVAKPVPATRPQFVPSRLRTLPVGRPAAST